ncbi:hypothetical protein Hanom_Chr15g01375471 [Helianthus anomalus]
MMMMISVSVTMIFPATMMGDGTGNITAGRMEGGSSCRQVFGSRSFCFISDFDSNPGRWFESCLGLAERFNTGRTVRVFYSSRLG